MFKRAGTSHYDSGNRYIEVTSPIADSQTNEVKGVMLVSVSTDTIVDTLHELRSSVRTVGRRNPDHLGAYSTGIQCLWSGHSSNYQITGNATAGYDEVCSMKMHIQRRDR